jgi:hypothetical protein
MVCKEFQHRGNEERGPIMMRKDTTDEKVIWKEGGKWVKLKSLFNKQ